MSTSRGFTLIELLVVVAVIGMIFGVVLALLSDAQKNARDKRRIADLNGIQKALELYYTDHQHYPKESDGANGDVATNPTFVSMMAPYMTAKGIDPAGIGNETFYYYYDGKAQCGSSFLALIFARQMDKLENANYASFLANSCGHVLDGEGRGGGEESYTILLGESGG